MEGKLKSDEVRILLVVLYTPVLVVWGSPHLGEQKEGEAEEGSWELRGAGMGMYVHKTNLRSEC